MSVRPETVVESIEFVAEYYYCALHLTMRGAARTFSNYPINWTNEYTNGGLVMQDPVFHWCLANEGAIRWSEIEIPDPSGIFGKGASHGLKFGMVVSIVDGDTRTMCSYANRVDEFGDRSMGLLENLSNQLHASTAINATITDDELETMQLIQFHSPADVAKQMGLSKAAIDKRLSVVRTKLGAINTTNAVVMLRNAGKL